MAGAWLGIMIVIGAVRLFGICRTSVLAPGYVLGDLERSTQLC